MSAVTTYGQPDPGVTPFRSTVVRDLRGAPPGRSPAAVLTLLFLQLPLEVPRYVPRRGQHELEVHGGPPTLDPVRQLRRLPELELLSGERRVRREVLPRLELLRRDRVRLVVRELERRPGVVLQEPLQQEERRRARQSRRRLTVRVPLEFEHRQLEELHRPHEPVVEFRCLEEEPAPPQRSRRPSHPERHLRRVGQRLLLALVQLPSEPRQQLQSVRLHELRRPGALGHREVHRRLLDPRAVQPEEGPRTGRVAWYDDGPVTPQHLEVRETRHVYLGRLVVLPALGVVLLELVPRGAVPEVVGVVSLRPEPGGRVVVPV